MPEWLQSPIGLIGLLAYAYATYRVRKYIFGNDNNSNNGGYGNEK